MCQELLLCFFSGSVPMSRERHYLSDSDTAPDTSCRKGFADPRLENDETRHDQIHGIEGQQLLPDLVMPVIHKNRPQGKSDEKEHLEGNTFISRKILFLHHLL